MKAVKFKLSGKNAFFKKPEVNSYCYFTYGQIHKITILGIFGAVLGYDGYGQQKEKKFTEKYPEFYQRLRNLKVCIIPRNKQGYIPKKIQQYNNSVGYASKEQSGNLIIKEQWLENPEWEIYLMLDCEEAEKVSEFLIKKKCVYLPYLGKNDHIADIENVEIVILNKVHLSNEVQIFSMFPKRIGDISVPDDEDEIEIFKYEEKLPIALNEDTNHYEFDTFCYTNLLVKAKEEVLYQEKEKILTFY